MVNIDLAPTILDMAGITIPEHMDGRSLLKLTRNSRYINRYAIRHTWYIFYSRLSMKLKCVIFVNIKIPKNWAISLHRIVDNAINESRHEISNNVVCATSKASDQPGHMRSLIRAFASGLNIQ